MRDCKNNNRVASGAQIVIPLLFARESVIITIRVITRISLGKKQWVCRQETLALVCGLRPTDLANCFFFPPFPFIPLCGYRSQMPASRRHPLPNWIPRAWRFFPIKTCNRMLFVSNSFDPLYTALGTLYNHTNLAVVSTVAGEGETRHARARKASSSALFNTALWESERSTSRGFYETSLADSQRVVPRPSGSRQSSLTICPLSSHRRISATNGKIVSTVAHPFFLLSRHCVLHAHTDPTMVQFLLTFKICCCQSLVYYSPPVDCQFWSGTLRARCAVPFLSFSPSISVYWTKRLAVNGCRRRCRSILIDWSSHRFDGFFSSSSCPISRQCLGSNPIQ